MKLRERRILYKKKRAQRNLEKIYNHYSHNDIVLHLQINNYIHTFCRDRNGKSHPDVYIESYIIRLEDRVRKASE